MKTVTLKAMVSACFLMILGTQAQAADFDCFPANLFIKSTDEIKDMISESMPLVVREGKNRKSTLTSVRSVTASGCDIKITFNAKLERKKKAIKKKRSVNGHAVLSASAAGFSGCLTDLEITELKYANTTNITERLIRGIYNRKLPDSVCPSDGPIEF